MKMTKKNIQAYLHGQRDAHESILREIDEREKDDEPPRANDC